MKGYNWLIKGWRGKPKPDKFGCIHYYICPKCEHKVIELHHFDLQGKKTKLTIGYVCPSCSYECFMLNGIWCGEYPILITEENGEIICRSDKLQYKTSVSRL